MNRIHLKTAKVDALFPVSRHTYILGQPTDRLLVIRTFPVGNRFQIETRDLRFPTVPLQTYRQPSIHVYRRVMPSILLPNERGVMVNNCILDFQSGGWGAIFPTQLLGCTPNRFFMMRDAQGFDCWDF